MHRAVGDEDRADETGLGTGSGLVTPLGPPGAPWSPLGPHVEGLGRAWEPLGPARSPWDPGPGAPGTARTAPGTARIPWDRPDPLGPPGAPGTRPEPLGPPGAPGTARSPWDRVVERPSLALTLTPS
eukprot:24164-Prymnesium_polylepis.1